MSLSINSQDKISINISNSDPFNKYICDRLNAAWHYNMTNGTFLLATTKIFRTFTENGFMDSINDLLNDIGNIKEDLAKFKDVQKYQEDIDKNNELLQRKMRDLRFFIYGYNTYLSYCYKKDDMSFIAKETDDCGISHKSRSVSSSWFIRNSDNKFLIETPTYTKEFHESDFLVSIKNLIRTVKYGDGKKAIKYLHFHIYGYNLFSEWNGYVIVN
jgi:hypothetical protein